jgi:hypothetical protein
VLAPLLKQLTEAALEAELDSHLANDVVPNRKNGKSGKTIKTSEGKIDLETPRDRAGTFEPQFIQKHQTSVSDEIETKILSMYGRGETGLIHPVDLRTRHRETACESGSGRVRFQIQCTRGAGPAKSLNQCDRACAGCFSRVTCFLDQMHGDDAVNDTQHLARDQRAAGE